MTASSPSQQPPPVGPHKGPRAIRGYTARVQLAVGLVADRLGYLHADALHRLMEEAESSGRSLDDVAIDVIFHVSPLDR